MELVVSLKKKEYLSKLVENGAESILYGSLFSLKYHYSPEELIEINKLCTISGVKSYISIDALINESDIDQLNKYLYLLSELDIEGIYFSDLSIIALSKPYGLSNKLIYDAYNLNTNRIDIGYYLSKDVDVVIARELCLDEIINIVSTYPKQLDMQIFGHLRMSYSKRPFISNYFKEIDRKENPVNKDSYTLIESTRANRLPIIETENGVAIYTDYVFMMFGELAYLKEYVKRGIVEAEFIPLDLLVDVIRAIRHLTKDNYQFLEKSIVAKHAGKQFADGYLYQKTSDRKEDE